MKRFVFVCSLLLVAGGSLILGQGVLVTGKVTGADDGASLPGVSVVVQGTTIGTVTDFEGNYVISIPDSANTLMFSYVGMVTRSIEIDGRSVVDVVMEISSTHLDEVVITALGISRESKSLGYAQQEIAAEEVNITSNANMKDALAGKVAGVQIVGQAGSKLGSTGRIRIRGAVSMTSDGDPLYVVDGIPVGDPNVIDMENVQSVSVLKGPNATALYGQRAEYGVILVTSKGAAGQGISVEVNNNTTIEKVAYLPHYQNLYGGGYDGNDDWVVMNFNAGIQGIPYAPEFEVFDGQRYIFNGYADESWGPRFDGKPYVAWYNVWPESPYYSQTATWEARPDNVRSFYDTGITQKNTVAISGNTQRFNSRMSYTHLDQKGIIPESYLKKNLVSANIVFNASRRLTITTHINWISQERQGDFDDSYSNQTSGSFNSWFNRNLEMDKMRELVDLKTTHGYHASWNYWGFDYGTYLGSEKGAFWYNPYFWLKHFKNLRNTNALLGKISLNYNIGEHLAVVAEATNSTSTFSRYYEFPFILGNSAEPEIYNEWASGGFGNYNENSSENNLSTMVKYTDQFGELDVKAFLGGNIRINSLHSIQADMDISDGNQGLVIPDVFSYSNAILPVTPTTYVSNKEVRSIYGSATLGYRHLVYLDITGRQDWSSALPAENNGYFYPSLGASFIFSELIDAQVLSYGKLRASWAQVGNDVSALAINPTYPLSIQPYKGIPQMYTIARAVDPNITPALSTSIEAGFDVSFLDKRAGLSFTYFDEVRENEIITTDMSTATGHIGYLTNAGRAHRYGVELTLNASPVRIRTLSWDLAVNLGTVHSEITELPGDLTSMAAPGGSDDWQFVTVTHELDNKWGQLRGRSIATDENGNYILNSNGTYTYNTGQYLGSVLPDFTGGILNTFTYRNLVSLSASIDFQKGGKFFSLSEMWGNYSGLLEETAVINDRGSNVRDDVAEGGGVHVVGVLENGDALDRYVEAQTYFRQFFNSTIPDPFIHDASYLKLREVSLSVNLPPEKLGIAFIKGVRIGIVGRNVAMLAVAKDNTHRWDPSELSHSYGENAQLPGTRSYGFDVKLMF